ncbi:unnamed protein product [Candidula unifasciata]|uniref:Uncharacterized protein n=1 Tax=Candidula unifasciata TaxID=100452 RepID=A0A8S3ZTM0_9EUPU|nr:unnamed protein product [Candidula unifasciata]
MLMRNLKMRQYGWRSTNNEDTYNSGVLVGNYNEERFDLKEIKKMTPLPSQLSHHYLTTYAEAYNKSQLHRYPTDLKLIKGRLPHAYSCHQPEMDSAILKATTNSWQTTQRASFLHPRLRLQPIKGTPDKIDFRCV